MANPPPPVKKKGLGCCGCGCLILALLLILLVALVVGGGYLTYNTALKITTTSPAAIPTFDGGDDVYNQALQKLKGFEHDAENHLAATIHLNADEINTLTARNPNFTNNQIRLFVILNDDQARLQRQRSHGDHQRRPDQGALFKRGCVVQRQLQCRYQESQPRLEEPQSRDPRRARG